MVDLRSPLNHRQRAVLAWIGAGCPEGTMQGHTHKTVAVALQNRHLVVVTKKGGTWGAELTEAGRYYVDHGTYAPRRTPDPPSVKPVPRPQVRRRPPTSNREQPRLAAMDRTGRPPEDHGAEVLVRRVLDAGGALEINGEQDHKNYEPLILASKGAPSLPFGKQLRKRSKGGFLSPLCEIYFDEDFAVRVDEQPVPVPARVTRYHPAVVTYRGDSDRHEVSRDALGRASRILQALAVEAERRGYSVTPVTEKRPGAELKAGQLSIGIDSFEYTLRMREKSAPGGGPSPVYSPYRKPAPRWQMSRQSKFVPTGSLTLTICEGYRRDGRPVEFRDTRATPLEQRLPAVLRELEIRALEDDWRRQEKERRAQEKRRRWEQAMHRAKHDLRETHRADVLRDQLERWHTANQLDEYLTAMRRAIAEATSDEERGEAERWLAWASEYRQSIDPLHHRLAMPRDPEPTPEALQPFLRGWSPYGPDGYP
jgi:hypothetical protein